MVFIILFIYFFGSCWEGGGQLLRPLNMPLGCSLNKYFTQWKYNVKCYLHENSKYSGLLFNISNLVDIPDKKLRVCCCAVNGSCSHDPEIMLSWSRELPRLCAVTTSSQSEFCLLLLHHFAVTTSSRIFFVLISGKTTVFNSDYRLPRSLLLFYLLMWTVWTTGKV